ncbi:MAG: hypothetical protein KF887_07145 [Paracoccaceae bacterium]|nr:MAG: hypothetical protein KF887_07145 [Paracoccaceae bacterium]
MREHDPALAALIAARRGLVVRLLFWIVARDRVTGDPEPFGFCSDVEPMTLTIGDDERVYHAAGGLLRSDPVIAETGLVVRMQTIRLSGVHPRIDEAMRAYDARLAPVELHRLVLDPETGEAAGPPVLLFRGVVDKAPIRTPEKGGTTTISLTLAPSARDLTRPLTLKKSDASQQLRGGDRFRRYADVSKVVDVWWGAARYTAPVAPPVTSTEKGSATAPGGDRPDGSNR